MHRPQIMHTRTLPSRSQWRRRCPGACPPSDSDLSYKSNIPWVNVGSTFLLYPISFLPFLLLLNSYSYSPHPLNNFFIYSFPTDFCILLISISSIIPIRSIYSLSPFFLSVPTPFSQRSKPFINALKQYILWSNYDYVLLNMLCQLRERNIVEHIPQINSISIAK